MFSAGNDLLIYIDFGIVSMLTRISQGFERLGVPVTKSAISQDSDFLHEAFINRAWR